MTNPPDSEPNPNAETLPLAKRLADECRTAVLAGLMSGAFAGYGLWSLGDADLWSRALMAGALFALGAAVLVGRLRQAASDNDAASVLRPVALRLGALFLSAHLAALLLCALRPALLTLPLLEAGLTPSVETTILLDLFLPLALLLWAIESVGRRLLAPLSEHR